MSTSKSKEKILQGIMGLEKNQPVKQSKESVKLMGEAGPSIKVSKKLTEVQKSSAAYNRFHKFLEKHHLDLSTGNFVAPKNPEMSNIIDNTPNYNFFRSYANKQGYFVRGLSFNGIPWKPTEFEMKYKETVEAQGGFIGEAPEQETNIGAQLPATNSFVAIEANAAAPQSLAVQLDQAAIEHAQSIPTLGNAGYNNDSQVLQNAIELQNSTPNVDEPAQQVTAFTDTTVLPTASNYLSFGVEVPPNIGVIHQQLQGPQFIGGSANSKSGGYYTLNYLGQVQELQTPVQQIAGNVEQMLSIDYKTPAGKQVLKEQQQVYSDIQKQMLAEQKMRLAPNNKQIVSGNMRDYQLQMAGYIPNPGATKKAHMQFLKDQIPYTQQSIAVVPSLFKEDDLLITENMNRYF